MKTFRQFFKKPASFILLMFFVLFSLGQLQRIQLQNDVAFYLYDVLIVGWLGVSYFLRKKSQQKRIKLFNILKKFFKKNKLFLFFIFWAGFSSLLGSFLGRVNFKSLLYVCRLIIYSFFIIDLNLEKNKFSFSFKKGFVVVSLFMSITGFLQYLFLPDTRFLNILGWDNHYYRLIGSLLDPAFMGMVAVLGLVGLENILNKLGDKVRKSNLKFYFLLAEITFITTIAFTFSRSSYLSLAIVLGLLFLHQKSLLKKIHYFLLGLVFLVTLVLLPKPSGAGVDLARTETLEYRIENSQAGIKALQGPQWIWGRGVFNNDSSKPSYTYQHAQVPDNLLVFLINSTGIIGTALFLTAISKWGIESWKKNPIWTIGLIAVLAHSMFNNTFLQPFVFLMLWGSRGDEVNKTKV